jgi:hypothetical protein
MKKFSNITGQKVNSEPEIKINKKEQELNELKYNIMDLMDNILSIQSFGSARTELLNGSVTISGKEMLAEALINLLGEKLLKSDIKVLESLKNDIRDWNLLDHKIDQINTTIDDKKLLENNKNLVNSISSFIKKYENDDMFDVLLEQNSNRIESPSEAFQRSFIADKMSNDINYNNLSKTKLNKFSNAYLERSKHLNK